MWHEWELPTLKRNSLVVELRFVLDGGLRPARAVLYHYRIQHLKLGKEQPHSIVLFDLLEVK